MRRVLEEQKITGEDGAKIIPRITGTAYINAEATLLLDPRDPFEMGIRG